MPILINGKTQVAEQLIPIGARNKFHESWGNNLIISNQSQFGEL